MPNCANRYEMRMSSGAHEATLPAPVTHPPGVGDATPPAPVSPEPLRLTSYLTSKVLASDSDERVPEGPKSEAEEESGEQGELDGIEVPSYTPTPTALAARAAYEDRRRREGWIV